MFLRSRGGSDPVNCLWVVDAATRRGAPRRRSRRRCSPDDDDDLPPEERARRERAREAAGGITGYATDARRSRSPRSPSPGGCSSRGLISGAGPRAARRRAGVRPPPRPDWRSASPTSAGGCCASASSTGAGACSPAATTTSPRRSRGAAPTSSPPRRWTATAATGGAPTAPRSPSTRVDTAPVAAAGTSPIPPTPPTPPRELAYPAAGTANADVTLHVVGLDGDVVDVEWDRDALPVPRRRALVGGRADHRRRSRATSARSRSSTSTRRRARPTCASPTTTTAGSSSSPARRACWTDGALVTCADRDGARRLLVDGEPVTPADLQVRSVVAVDGGGIVFIANPIDDATVDPRLALRRRTGSPR